jgi:hypothetical protein
MASAVVLAVACVMPSDRSARLGLAFDPIPTVYVGDTVQLSAHVVYSVAAGVVRSEDILMASASPGVLDVSPMGLAVARAAGSATVTARPRSADAEAASADVTVLDVLRIDSVSTAFGNIYPGDSLRVYGVGLDTTRTSLTIGGLSAPIVEFQPENPGRVGGPSRLVVLVPAVFGVQARITARRGQRSTTLAAALAIAQADRLEPNDAAPHYLGLLGSLIRHGSLFLEGLSAGIPSPRDWYTFSNPNNQFVTVVLKPEGASVDELSLTVSDTLDSTGAPLPQSWLQSVGGNYCRGTFIPGYNGVLDSQVVTAFLPPGTQIHVLIGTQLPITAARSYELRIEQGYHIQAPSGASHRNGNCESPTLGYLFGSSSAPNPAVESIDNPGAVAWYSFFVAAPTTFVFSVGLVASALSLPSPVMDVLQFSGLRVFRSSVGQIACLGAGSYLLAVSSASGGTGRFTMFMNPDPTTPCVAPAPGSRP